MRDPTVASRAVNVLLVASGRCHDTELSGRGIDHHLRVAHGCRVDPGNEGACLGRANADGLRLVARALVADVDIVVARLQGHAGLVTNTDVLCAEAFLE